MIAYFMGVKPGDSSGHFCYTSGWSRPDRDALRTPWAGSYDPLTEVTSCRDVRAAWGLSLERIYEYGPQPEGEHRLLHENGWTCLSMWDRSADRRGACTASFAFEGTHDFPACIALARVHFPGIIERIEAHIQRSLTKPLESLSLSELLVEAGRLVAHLEHPTYEHRLLAELVRRMSSSTSSPEKD